MNSRQASRSPRDSHAVSLSFGSFGSAGALLWNSRAKAWLAIAPRLNHTPCPASSSFSVSISKSNAPRDSSAPAAPYLGSIVNLYRVSGVAV